ncbi:hypothetical protein GQ44DRAFT_395418 [Phaeosphaeriaceae sp. PMI808]|nr:hypothetical protein GQ44DRAFT_395418 [Phaeosphaeriaceae sp. PMI808]
MNLHIHANSVTDLPMEYIKAVFEHISRLPEANKESTSPIQPAGIPGQQRKRKHHRYGHHNHDMVSFNGPWSQDLDALNKSVQSMPDKYKSSFASASKDTLEKICEATALHVWETDSDIDSLIQLTSVIAKLCNLGTRKEKGFNADDGRMVIIAQEKNGHDSFARISRLVAYLTCANAKMQLGGTVATFGSLVVVKGWNNAVRSENATRAAEQTVKRINTTIERVFGMGKFSGGKKIVWHHGAVVHFFLHWINSTTSKLRSSLLAATITGSLDLKEEVKPSVLGRANTLTDLELLESFAKRLDIPVVFLDCSSQLIASQHLGTYLYYYGYYINTYLPKSLSRPHLHQAQDDLVTFAFRLLGASKGKYGESMVKLVKEHLDPKAKKWARQCIEARNFEKSRCRSAGKEAVIHRAVQISDGPFIKSNHDHGLTAFARLAVGPTAAGSIDSHIASPVQIDFKTSRLRASKPAPFYILIPVKSQNADKVTNHIQGIMMAVLECVRQEKGNPTFDSEEREMWKAVTQACLWAFKECKGKVPDGVDGKVRFVKEKLTKGTWAQVIGSSANESGGKGGREAGMSGQARANADAVKMYGAGGNRYGQVRYVDQHPMGYGQQQQQYMGQPGYGAAQQGYAVPQNYQSGGQPQVNAYQGQYPQQGFGQGYNGTAQAHGYDQGYGGHAQTQGYRHGYNVPPPVHSQQQGNAGYKQRQRSGGGYVWEGQGGREGGGYTQSMGGPSWA